MKTPSLIDKAFQLKQTALFGSLDLDLLLAIADKAAVATFKVGEAIFDLDGEGSRMYLILKGQVQILGADKRYISQLGPGDFFGDESVFNDKPRGYYAVSQTDTQLLTLSRTHLLTIISECPAVALGLLQVYTSSLTFRPRSVSEEVS